MSWIALILGLLLALAGGAALVASIDLLPTELGLLFATCGAIAISGGIIVIAIGLLIRRVDALRKALSPGRERRPSRRSEPLVPPLVTGIEPTVLDELGATPSRDAPASELSAPASDPEPASFVAGDADSAEAPINENRKGHLPSLEALEGAAEEPAPPPTLVGRYSAGGANYSIFSDGSIEAATDQGDFKFGSMSEFKALSRPNAESGRPGDQALAAEDLLAGVAGTAPRFSRGEKTLDSVKMIVNVRA